MSIKRWKLGWKRCDCVKCEAAITIEETQESCGWVMWEHHKEEVARLKAEVERLRKAGDELRDSLPYIVDERLDDKTMRKIMNRWNAAKEGKPSV